MIYDNHLAVLQQSYTELTMASQNRLADLQRLQEFMQFTWLNEKEKIEITRDWSSKLLNLENIQSYYKVRLAVFYLFDTTLNFRNTTPQRTMSLIC